MSAAVPLFDPVPELDRKRRRKGPAERAALADLRELRRAGALPPNSRALQLAYRLAAWNVDVASAGTDPYAVNAALQEMSKRRAALGGLDAAVTDDAATKIHADLVAKIAAEP